METIQYGKDRPDYQQSLEVVKDFLTKKGSASASELDNLAVEQRLTINPVKTPLKTRVAKLNEQQRVVLNT